MSTEANTAETRRYRKRARAEQERRTREAITEAAVKLHGSVGPARTTISAVADEAGVQRATVYRHFPDEEALFAACSSHWRTANPPPDPSRWSTIPNAAERTETALRELYEFYGRTEAMYDSLLRDEAVHPIVKRLLRHFYNYLRTVEDVLMAGRGLRGRRARSTRAAVAHAAAFPTWHSLAREQGLRDDEAVALMCLLVEGAAARA